MIKVLRQSMRRAKGLYKGIITFIVSTLIASLLHLACSMSSTEEKTADIKVPLHPIEELNFRKYLGQNLVLFLYSIDDPRVQKAVTVMKDLYYLRKEYNFEVVGVSLNPDKETAVQDFNQSNGIAFPVFMDSTKKLYTRFKMTGELGFYIFDRQGKTLGGKLSTATPQNIDLERYWYGYAAKYLNIAYIPEDRPVLGIKPPVPLIEGKALDGRVVNIQELYQNKPVVIVIFSPKCSHCRNELDFLSSLYHQGDLQGRFEIVAISTLDKAVTEKLFLNKKYSFPVMIDRDKQFSSLFPSFVGPVPVSFVVDRQGRINSFHAGYTQHIKDIYLMELRKLAGLPNPPLLVKNGYSGEQHCGVCHEKEHIQWSLTKHSDAFLSLIRKGMDDDESCISCHVTGFGEDGGYRG